MGGDPGVVEVLHGEAVHISHPELLRRRQELAEVVPLWRGRGSPPAHEGEPAGRRQGQESIPVGGTFLSGFIPEYSGICSGYSHHFCREMTERISQALSA